SLACCLMQRLREIGMRGTEYAKAQAGTHRLRLLKIGAVIIRNTRRIRFLLSSAYPHQQLFCQVVARLDTG
ncbi:MAG: transposase, partial [Proteobacteria bacterium]|nr:transposase [Pseudomonadota bacterium]